MNSPTTTATLSNNKVGSVDNNKHVNSSSRRSSWKWWSSSNNNNKISDQEKMISTINQQQQYDYDSSIEQSSLVVQHSIHSKESDDILSTISIKSKPWVSQKLKSATASTCPTQQEEKEEEEDVQQDNHNNNNNNNNNTNDDPIAASSSSVLYLQNVPPSITSSTVPVFNFDPNKQERPPPRKRGFDNVLFSGIKAKLGKWVMNKSSSDTTNKIQ